MIIPASLDQQLNVFVHRAVDLSPTSRRKAPSPVMALLLGGVRLLLLGIVAATLSMGADAQTTINVTVQSTEEPWSQTLNPGFTFGVNNGTGPTVISAASGIPFVPGGTVR